MSATHRCFCTLRKCDQFIDPHSHKREGCPVLARVLRQHKQDELQNQICEAAQKTLANVVESQNKLLSQRLEQLNPPSNDETRPEPREKYRIDRVKHMVATVSNIKDSIPGLLASVDVSPPPSPEVASARQLDLDRLINRGIQMEMDLSIVRNGTKEPAVIALYDKTIIELQKCISTIKAQQTSLEAAKSQFHQAPAGNHSHESGRHYEDSFLLVKPIIQLSLFMVVVCSAILGTSRRGCTWLFKMTEFIIRASLIEAVGLLDHLLPYLLDILSDFPKDIRTATAKFDLEAKSVTYAVCPSCHHTYAPLSDTDIPTYQERCNFRRYTGGSRCGDLLLRPKVIHGHRIFVPIKTFIAFDFKDWLAGLLSRPGYEAAMDKSWKGMDVEVDGKISSIFQGAVLRDFKGPDGETHFSVSDDEGRYVFSMSMDFFNPLGNKVAGKRISIGVISLVALNLPPELRYKPENMFLAGIIPGPKEPPLDAINPYMAPIVDIFLELWEFGVYFSRTFGHPWGRRVLCALIVLICDLPAARKAGGFSACSHSYFCSICWCKRQTEGYNDFSFSSWKRRTNQECRDYAEDFLNTPDAKCAQSCFKRSGVRWSELLRLPYFDPSRFVVVDSMHNLLLGLIKDHFVNVLGFKPEKPPTLAVPDAIRIDIPALDSNPPPTLPTDQGSVAQIIAMLQKPLDFSDQAAVDTLSKRLSSCRLQALAYVARGVSCPGLDQGCLIHSSIAQKLLDWRKLHSTPLDREIASSDQGGALATKELTALWEDIERTVTPSWTPSIPTTIGVSGGKLKADQWRTVGSIYLPITLTCG